MGLGNMTPGTCSKVGGWVIMLRIICMETHPRREMWAAELQGLLTDSPATSWIPRTQVGSQGPSSSVESPWHLRATLF